MVENDASKESCLTHPSRNSVISADSANLRASLEGLLRDLSRHVQMVSNDAVRTELRSVIELVDRGRLEQTKRRLSRATVTSEGALDWLGEEEVEQLLQHLVRLCIQADLQLLLRQNNVEFPVYNLLRSFEENAPGPWDHEPNFREAVSDSCWRLLGRRVGFPVGVPASVLTANHSWVRYFAKRGFNVLTYKTVRSVAYEPHAFPHWVFLEGPTESWFGPDEVAPVVGGLETWPKDFNAFSTANSFGVPSPEPAVWQRDVDQTLELLGDDQLLILSVMGTPELKERNLVEDFVRTARLAASTSVSAIELNLSCPNSPAPNSDGMEDPVCFYPDRVTEIVKAVRESVDVKLVVKLSYLERDRLLDVVGPISLLVDGVSGINTVQTEVRTPEGQPAFKGTAQNSEHRRDIAGVSGIAIRELGLDFVRSVASFRAQEGATFDILGMGGVMGVDDVDAYRRAGADAVQTATAAWVNTLLPSEIAQLGIEPPEEKVVRLLTARGSLDLAQIASATRLSSSVAKHVVNRLISEGAVVSMSSNDQRSRYRINR